MNKESSCRSAKMSIGKADYISREMNQYNASPYYKKRYITNRINSMAEVKRIYYYLVGSLKGYTLMEKAIKNKSPKAYKSVLKDGTHVEWHLNTDVVWEILTSDPKTSGIIKGRAIKTYEELCYRADISGYV